MANTPDRDGSHPLRRPSHPLPSTYKNWSFTAILHCDDQSPSGLWFMVTAIGNVYSLDRAAGGLFGDRCGTSGNRRNVGRLIGYKMGLPEIELVEVKGFFGSRDLAFVPAGEYSIRLMFECRRESSVPDCQDIECPSSGRLSCNRRSNSSRLLGGDLVGVRDNLGRLRLCLFCVAGLGHKLEGRAS